MKRYSRTDANTYHHKVPACYNLQQILHKKKRSDKKSSHGGPCPPKTTGGILYMTWQFDTAHSNIAFSAKHMMISTVRGRFDTWSGTIELDEQRPEAAHVEVMIEAASLDTNQPQRDAHLKSP